ncbi:RidA family protein [Actinocatenispora sera]|uniref:RidA family protein n=1 Tax=Actinocatenispora sera TaxID=390989 RepID=UPI0033D7F2A5
MIEFFERPDGAPPANGYSHAARAAGRLVAASGQLPIDAQGVLVGAEDALAQGRQVFANLGTALAAAGAGPRDLLRLTFFLTDLADLPAVRTARDEFLAGGPLPTSSLVQVVGLILPGARIEIDALAVVDAGATG